MPRGNIFRKQRFMCGGCGKVVNAKVTTTPEEAHDVLPPPEGWFVATFAGQDAQFGAVAIFQVFAHSEACAESVARGEGQAGTVVRSFKSYLTSIQASAATPDVASADEDDDEPEYEEDNSGPQVPQA